MKAGRHRDFSPRRSAFQPIPDKLAPSRTIHRSGLGRAVAQVRPKGGARLKPRRLASTDDSKAAAFAKSAADGQEPVANLRSGCSSDRSAENFSFEAPCIATSSAATDEGVSRGASMSELK